MQMLDNSDKKKEKKNVFEILYNVLKILHSTVKCQVNEG